MCGVSECLSISLYGGGGTGCGGRPYSDLYLKAARHMNVSPHDCLTLNGSPAGVAAAANAHMCPIGLPFSLSLITLWVRR